ncbi:TetR family transcriptional regulator [Glaciihabitans tibetensis]|uniref:TetR family transcriptional regulator n=1 Tax=Glaciihabitans tibetensis TaxID=1266600 RepID=A0A2T0VAQ4_9MICO|nr:TetR/AcrR family transcriptional regulator [Glaciihabitans tibetensis]PRY67272.1 TetR family transcriptional regulator [Glaciihabitans tibetensis]
MPKIVDHDQRRREILQATWRVIANQGIDAATIREIAREAGFSNGVLSHYFTNKEEILISAHRLAFQQVYDRASKANEGIVGIEAVRRALYEALPLDAERRIEAILDVSFWSQALVNDRLNAVRRDSIMGGREWWKAMLLDGRARNEIVASLSDDVLCDEIQALIDGISVQAVMYPDDMIPSRQKAMADAFLSRITA